MVVVVSAAQRGGALLVAVLVIVVDFAGERLASEDASQQPTAAQVIGVDDAAVAQLDALAGPVDPGKVEVEGRLDDAEDDRDRVWLFHVCVELAQEPVDEVEAAVGAQEDNVEGGDDGRDGGLAEEEELREHADGFEHLGEDPEPLTLCVRAL